MYKYLKKIIHNLWHNCLVNPVLTKNLSCFCTGMGAALRWHWWDPVLCSLPCFGPSLPSSLSCLLLRCPYGHPEQPMSQVRRRVLLVISASHLQQEGWFGSRCANFEVTHRSTAPDLDVLHGPIHQVWFRIFMNQKPIPQ